MALKRAMSCFVPIRLDRLTMPLDVDYFPANQASAIRIA